MKFKLPAGDSRDLIGALSTLVEEATFTAGSDGIAFRGMDPSHVALIDVNIALNPDLDGKEPLRFALRVDELGKIIKRAGTSGMIEFGVGEGRLSVLFGKKTYKLRLIDPLESDTPIPKVGYAAGFTISSSDMVSALSDIAVVSNFVEVVSSDNGIAFYGKGDTGEASTVPDGLTAGKAGMASATYSLEYLMPFCKAVSGTLNVELAENKPLRITCGGITFYLAPRVES